MVLEWSPSQPIRSRRVTLNKVHHFSLDILRMMYDATRLMTPMREEKTSPPQPGPGRGRTRERWLLMQGNYREGKSIIRISKCMHQ